jgi:hypothetical protein
MEGGKSRKVFCHCPRLLTLGDFRIHRGHTSSSALARCVNSRQPSISVAFRAQRASFRHASRHPALADG